MTKLGHLLIQPIILLLKVQHRGLNRRALPPFPLKLPANLVHLILLKITFPAHFLEDPFELSALFLQLFGLVVSSLGLFGLVSQALVLGLHFAQLFVRVFFLGHCGASLTLHLGLQLLDLVGGQLGFSLQGHVVFVIVACLSYFFL